MTTNERDNTFKVRLDAEDADDAIARDSQVVGKPTNMKRDSFSALGASGN